MTSDRYFSTDPDPEFDYGFETADNFTNVGVNSPGETLRVTWWGSVETGTTPVSQFALRFYNPTNQFFPFTPTGGPFYAGGLTPTETTFLNTAVGRDFYRYSADLSSAPSLNSANDYFLSIYAFGTETDPGTGFPVADPNGWQWTAASDILNGNEVFRDFSLGNGGSWQTTTDDVIGRAFSLETIPNPSHVPEPSSMALLGLLGAGYGYRRKRARDRKAISETATEKSMD